MQTLFHKDVAAGIPAAPVICFSDRASFCAAVTALTFLNFSGCNADPEFTEYPDGLTIQEVHFSVSCHADFPTSVLVYTSDPCGQGDAQGPVLYAGGAEALHVALPAGTTAFGADFLASSLDPAAALWVSINEEPFLIPTPRARQAGCLFAGFLSPIPITQSSFGGSDSGPVLAGVYYGHAQSILSR